jgi:hypothetical protein
VEFAAAKAQSFPYLMYSDCVNIFGESGEFDKCERGVWDEAKEAEAEGQEVESPFATFSAASSCVTGREDAGATRRGLALLLLGIFAITNHLLKK